MFELSIALLHADNVSGCVCVCVYELWFVFNFITHCRHRHCRPRCCILFVYNLIFIDCLPICRVYLFTFLRSSECA